MPVLVRFKDGLERSFPSAKTAFYRGALLVIPADGKETEVSGREVATVTITDEWGVVETLGGLAESN